MLYTVVPEEAMFQEINMEVKQTMYLIHQRPVLCIEKPHGKLEVVQLLSTDPQDFLRNDFYPGQEISLLF